jgi:5-oxoprolinase (ATP-hydrolysing)
MDRALAAGGAAVRALLPSLRPGVAEDEVDGVPLRVAITPLHDHLRVDLSGTGGPHPGNRNAPRGVVRAAVLYALRVRLADDQPLHEGVLDAVDLVLPPGSLVDPPSQAAVSGGNVETSQALVDLLFEALDLRAASQGTMNNLTLGGPGWSLYETLGGGTGATALGDGAGPGQVHMTNTRATDPEVLELRLPVRVIRFAIRRGSGGAGRRRGGDGLIRELEVTAPATAALLASRRDRGPRGLRGGGPGLAGVDTLILGGVERVWDGAPTALAPGDRVRVETPGGGGYGPPPEVR